MQVFSSVSAALTHVSTLLTCHWKSWALDWDPIPLSSFIDLLRRSTVSPISSRQSFTSLVAWALARVTVSAAWASSLRLSLTVLA
ncbi:hypothetical protein EUGRSUZ_A02881 [Eucalyptus grandis]|uniref:Uncharacterized protein n=2 Tax=Eucalyptus grandis TaxID=71139 RepID=A0A059DKA5_EUCGR|nr:hypothetical protein EUGRSUZ_A02881 [Eucalyptus grandis]